MDIQPSGVKGNYYVSILVEWQNLNGSSPLITECNPGIYYSKTHEIEYIETPQKNYPFISLQKLKILSNGILSVSFMKLNKQVYHVLFTPVLI